MSPKIVVASSGLGHVARGIEAWSQDLASALRRRGVDVILCKGAGTPAGAYERVLPCLTRESDGAARLGRWVPKQLGWRLGVGDGYGVEQTTFAISLLRLLRRERPDILHVQDPEVAWIVEKARRARLTRTRTILAHGTEETFQFLSGFTYVQHLAPWHLEDARTEGFWKPTWVAIPNFIDVDRFSPGVDSRADEPLATRRELNIPERDIVVLSVAALKRHHKRVDHVLQEFQTLVARRPELPLRLVLAGGWESETESLIAEWRPLLGDRVIFLPRFARERMPQLYRAADIFTLGSLKEMMPIALLEATASGLPCVVHRHPILAWMIGPGGVTIDMSARGALADEMESLAVDENRRRQLGGFARSHCTANFSEERVVRLVLDYYDAVIQRTAIMTDQTSIDAE